MFHVIYFFPVWGTNEQGKSNTMPFKSNAYFFHPDYCRKLKSPYICGLMEKMTGCLLNVCEMVSE